MERQLLKLQERIVYKEYTENYFEIEQVWAVLIMNESPYMKVKAGNSSSNQRKLNHTHASTIVVFMVRYDVKLKHHSPSSMVDPIARLKPSNDR
mmetsp:Transcript_208/g.323  ORF Transcript_208/g.323 Transcript_208/m.323 type:complete len:94 (-) Transcript_208:765-1046(-)